MNIVALSTEVVERWRTARIDEYGHALTAIVADEPHAFPCRHCLRDADPGEPMLLASHSPFALPGPYIAVDGELERLLARDDVAYVHVRFARPGCFACRVER